MRRVTRLDTQPSTTHCCCLSDRYDENQSSVTPFRPQSSSFLNKILCETVSKAFARSRSTIKLVMPLSMLRYQLKKIMGSRQTGRQTDRPRLYGENLSRVEWSPSLPRQLQRNLRKKLPFCPVQKLTTALAHALIVSPWPSWPGKPARRGTLSSQKGDPARRITLLANFLLLIWKIRYVL